MRVLCQWNGNMVARSYYSLMFNLDRDKVNGIHHIGLWKQHEMIWYIKTALKMFDTWHGIFWTLVGDEKIKNMMESNVYWGPIMWQVLCNCTLYTFIHLIITAVH